MLGVKPSSRLLLQLWRSSVFADISPNGGRSDLSSVLRLWDRTSEPPEQKPAVCSLGPVSHATARPTNRPLIKSTLSNIHQKTDPRLHDHRLWQPVVREAKRDKKMQISFNRFENGTITVCVPINSDNRLKPKGLERQKVFRLLSASEK